MMDSVVSPLLISPRAGKGHYLASEDGRLLRPEPSSAGQDTRPIAAHYA